MAMHPFQRINCLKGEFACEHLVEGYTQRIQVTAMVNSTVHTPGLLWRHVRQVSFDKTELRRNHRHIGERSGKTKISEFYPIGRWLNKDASWFDVLVNNSLVVNIRQSGSELHGDIEKSANRQRLTELAGEEFAVEIFENQMPPRCLRF